MTKALLRNVSPLLPLLLLLSGCAAPASPTTAGPNQPGVGKGHWVTENAPTTGSMQPRRYWVSDEPGATAANGSGVNSYSERSVTSGGGSTGGLSSGGAGGGGGFGGAGGGGGR